jgi:hypothetical protein
MKRRASGNLSAAMESAAGGSGSAPAASAAAAPQEVSLHSFDIFDCRQMLANAACRCCAAQSRLFNSTNPSSFVIASLRSRQLRALLPL